MRSIRLSLTVYFLVLLAVTLGTASVLVYRTTKRTLEDKEKAAEQLVHARYEEARGKENQKLDTALLQQARTVAQLVQFQKDWARIHQFNRDWERWATPERRIPERRISHQATELLAAGAMPNPGSAARLAFWSVEASHHHFPRAVYGWFLSSLKPEIRLQNSDPLPPIDEQVAEYFQIDSAWGSSYRSRALAQKGKHFDVDPEVFGPNRPAINWEWEDVPLAKGQVVRRVALTAPAARQVPMFPPSGRTSQGRPALYIQYACDTHKHEAALATLGEQRDQELERVRDETRASLAGLRTHLLAINGCAFAALVLGICVLVRLGLAPLDRLGEAVSRVSEKDFRLQLGDRRMPRELSPIVERLTQTLEQLKRAFAREKQATADISHELRTPLAALMTTIDVTLRKPRSADEYREALEDCKASGLQIHEAVERLLALARLDAGVDRLRSQAVDAASLARQCVSVVKPLAEAHGLQLSVHGDDSAPLKTDPDKLREVLNNLLHNAIQYNRQGGSVDVSVHRDNGHLELRVCDTGIGIPEAARPHIFERFYRVDPSRHSDGLHAGLGLAIVKGYLDLMGGSIDVSSVEGQGSTFNVRLPA